MLIQLDDETTLDGSASFDADGSIVSYTWSQVSGPSGISLSGQNTAKLSITSLQEGSYTFLLKVTDDDGGEDSDQVTLVVNEVSEPFPAPVPTDDCGCDHTITAAQPYVNGASMGIKPGDVICIEAGNYPYLNLFNFKGSAEKPLLFKNCGGQVLIGGSSTNYGIVMNNNQYFQFTGTGDGNFKYGFKVDGQTRYLASGFAIATKSSDFELDHIEITKVEAGVLAKTNPTCDATTWNGNYTMRNVKFHDFYIHGIEGEGFYIGHTSLSVNINCEGSIQEVVPHDIEHIRVYDNILESTGWDGIQVSRASKDCEIYNNRVYDYGTVNKSSQQAGIIVGGVSTGKVYNNWVEKGTGAGIQVFGTGEVDVYNNVIKDAGEDAIFCDDRSPVPVSARFINNTIITPKRDGIRLYNDEGYDNIVCNNLIVSPGSLGDYGNDERAYLFVANGVDFAKSTNYFTASTEAAKFDNFVEADFQLSGNSPAVDAGTDVRTYGIDEDCLGNARPANNAYDIGAFEALSDPAPSPAPSPIPESPQKTNGLNYRYYEGSWSVLPSFSELIAVKSGQVANFDLSIRERDDNFGVLYEGYIEIPESGQYTFETASDDGSKLYIGGYDETHVVVNNDGLHAKRFRAGTVELEAGLHPIVVTFFERSGGQVLEVYWKNTAHGVATRQLIPNDLLHVELEEQQDDSDTVAINGLNYRYYEGSWSVLPSFNELSEVKSGQVANFDLSIRERDDNFGVLYEGYIEIPESGQYTFETASDDGSKLYIGGYDETHVVVNNDGLHAKRFRAGTVELEAGLHPIVVTFFEKSGGQVLEVYWKNTAHGVTTRQLIPDSLLFTNARDTTAQVPTNSPEPSVDVDPVISSTIYQINISKQGFSSGLSDWFDIPMDNVSGSSTFNQIADTEGNSSDISIAVYNGISGSTILGVADNQSGLTNGIFPNSVLKHAAYTTGEGVLEIRNLNLQKVYNIKLLGGRAGSGERFTEYTVNGNSKTLQCMNNSSQTVLFEEVSADAGRKISIKFRQAGNTWAYLNAIVIEEIDTQVARIDNQSGKELLSVGQSIESEIVQSSSEISVYPNPFRSNLTINLGNTDSRLISVSILDQFGQTVYQDIAESEDTGQLNINLDNQITRSGVYVVRVELDNKIVKMFRLLAE